MELADLTQIYWENQPEWRKCNGRRSGVSAERWKLAQKFRGRLSPECRYAETDGSRSPQFAIRNCQGFFSGFHFGMDDFGLRRQSWSGDGAFGRTGNKLMRKISARAKAVSRCACPRSPKSVLGAIRNSKLSGLLLRFSFWDGRLGHLAVVAVALRRGDNSPAIYGWVSRQSNVKVP